MTYDEKLNSLREKIQCLQSDSLSVDHLSQSLEEAFQLIQDLRKALTQTQLQVNAVLAEQSVLEDKEEHHGE